MSTSDPHPGPNLLGLDNTEVIVEQDSAAPASDDPSPQPIPATEAEAEAWLKHPWKSDLKLTGDEEYHDRPSSDKSFPKDTQNPAWLITQCSQCEPRPVLVVKKHRVRGLNEQGVLTAHFKAGYRYVVEFGKDVGVVLFDSPAGDDLLGMRSPSEETVRQEIIGAIFTHGRTTLTGQEKEKVSQLTAIIMSDLTHPAFLNDHRVEYLSWKIWNSPSKHMRKDWRRISQLLDALSLTNPLAALDLCLAFPFATYRRNLDVGFRIPACVFGNTDPYDTYLGEIKSFRGRLDTFWRVTKLSYDEVAEQEARKIRAQYRTSHPTAHLTTTSRPTTNTRAPKRKRPATAAGPSHSKSRKTHQEHECTECGGLFPGDKDYARHRGFGRCAEERREVIAAAVRRQGEQERARDERRVGSGVMVRESAVGSDSRSRMETPISPPAEHPAVGNGASNHIIPTGASPLTAPATPAEEVLDPLTLIRLSTGPSSPAPPIQPTSSLSLISPSDILSLSLPQINLELDRLKSLCISLKAHRNSLPPLSKAKEITANLSSARLHLATFAFSLSTADEDELAAAQTEHDAQEEVVRILEEQKGDWEVKERVEEGLKRVMGVVEGLLERRFELMAGGV